MVKDDFRLCGRWGVVRTGLEPETVGKVYMCPGDGMDVRVPERCRVWVGVLGEDGERILADLRTGWCQKLQEVDVLLTRSVHGLAVGERSCWFKIHLDNNLVVVGS